MFHVHDRIKSYCLHSYKFSVQISHVGPSMFIAITVFQHTEMYSTWDNVLAFQISYTLRVNELVRS